MKNSILLIKRGYLSAKNFYPYEVATDPCHELKFDVSVLPSSRVEDPSDERVKSYQWVLQTNCIRNITTKQRAHGLVLLVRASQLERIDEFQIKPKTTRAC